MLNLDIPLETQRWLFAAFFLAFAVKVPIFPVHTWLPDAHTEAPTGGSVFLAAILLKMGTFGLLRYCLPLFPDATVEFTPWILGLAVIGVLYGAVVALMQAQSARPVKTFTIGFAVPGYNEAEQAKARSKSQSANDIRADWPSRQRLNERWRLL